MDRGESEAREGEREGVIALSVSDWWGREGEIRKVARAATAEVL